MLLFCIRSLVDNLCRCMLVCCPMHFVLNLLEKQNGTFSLGVIINAGRINLQHLSPEYLFRRPDIPDSGKQLIKVVAAAEIFQAVIIQHKALFHELLEDRGRPHAELNTALRLHTIPNRYDNVQIVVFNLPLYLPFAFHLNCCKFCNSCSFVQFALFVNITDVARNCGLISLKQICHLVDGKPDRISVKRSFDFCQAVFRCI